MATVLGLVATLWATLAGESVRDALRAEDAPIKAFRSKVESVCSPRVRRPLQSLRREMEVRLPLFLGSATVNFAAIEAPSLYAREYVAFRNEIRRVTAAVQSPDVWHVPLQTKDPKKARRLQAKLHIAWDASADAVGRAVTMQVQDCVQMLTAIGLVVDRARIISEDATRRSPSTSGHR
jgi:hypothetical protein